MVKNWLRKQNCDFDELDITSDVKLLREWRALTGDVGVPVVAHGNDIVIGFNEDRLAQLLDCCEHTTEVPVAAE